MQTTYPIASDEQVPNPDRALWVRFFSKPLYLEYETKQHGRPMYKDMDYIHIEMPGDRNSIIERVVMDSDKVRFPMEWQGYKNMGLGADGTVGTAITQWPLISAAQAEELKAIKFHTVEQLALASDAQLQNIGMIAGMAPMTLRDKAKQFLYASKNQVNAEQIQQQLEEKDKALQETQAKLATMEQESKAQIEALQKQMLDLAQKIAAPQPAPEPKRRGRPPKAREAQAA